MYFAGFQKQETTKLAFTIIYHLIRYILLTNLLPESEDEIMCILLLEDICRFHGFPLKIITLNSLFQKIMTDNFFLYFPSFYSVKQIKYYLSQH